MVSEVETIGMNDGMGSPDGGEAGCYNESTEDLKSEDSKVEDQKAGDFKGEEMESESEPRDLKSYNTMSEDQNSEYHVESSLADIRLLMSEMGLAAKRSTKEGD